VLLQRVEPADQVADGSAILRTGCPNERLFSLPPRLEIHHRFHSACSIAAIMRVLRHPRRTSHA
jgi:hypothetical protein